MNKTGVIDAPVVPNERTSGGTQDAPRLAALHDRFETLLRNRIEGVTVNGVLDSRLSGASFLTFDGIDVDALIVHLPSFDLSAASACHSGVPELSYALRATG